MKKELLKKYIQILKDELVPAMGCTEPISLAFVAAKARDILVEKPIRGKLYVSPNIVKNTKSVVVPNTSGMKGLKAAFAAGLVSGNSEENLQVISKVEENEKIQIKDLVDNFDLEIIVPEDAEIFDIRVELFSKNHSSFVKVVGDHTNIVYASRDNNPIFEKKYQTDEKEDKAILSVEGICEFAKTVEINDIKDILDRQIEYNMTIAEEGLNNCYGANIGKTLLNAFGDNIKTKAKAYAASASDARMNGCELPVVINSGSGNQGITCSVPVIVYARELNCEIEKLYRALCVSNLVTIHLKTGIGTLSAYCGAVSAGVGAGAGITYLYGGGLEEISHTIVNSLAIDSGIICDGAKASCAAKIAMSVEAGILGYEMFKAGNQFYGGDGIVSQGVENTIKNVSVLAKEGMLETDKAIINIMLNK